MTERIDTTDWRRMEYINFYTKVWGVPVIPVRNNKMPAVKWTPYQTRMPTEDELDEWFVRQQPWGMAIVLQNGLFSPDIDTVELYDLLFKSGAFHTGTCIYKSARGYHAIMRSGTIEPYAVKEHNAVLTAADPLLCEFGISGANQLAIVPDTPGREWIALYDDPKSVDYESWLKRYIGYSREIDRIYGTEISMRCPYGKHKDEEPSLFINRHKGVFHCFGCGARGTLDKLLKDSAEMGFTLPDEIMTALKSYLSLPALKLSDAIEEEQINTIIEKFLEGGDNGTAIISGGSGVGKTSLGLSIALSLCRGEPVLGKLKVPAAKKVVLINFESRGENIIKQARFMSKTLGTTSSLAIIDGRTVRSYDEESIERLVRSITLAKAEVVIMDSIQAFVRDYNSQEEAVIFWNLVMRLRDELGCAVINLHHTATGLDAGTGAERAKGAIGKLLATYCATKLLYADLEGEKYYGRLSGSTRAWGQVDWCIAYEGITGIAAIADWRDMDRETREGLGRPPIVDLLDQALILARRMGKTKTECAEEIGVNKSSLTRYLNGEQYPDIET